MPKQRRRLTRETKENSEETATNEIVLPEAEGTEDAETAEEDAAEDAGQAANDALSLFGRWQRRNSGGGSRCVVQ